MVMSLENRGKQNFSMFIIPSRGIKYTSQLAEDCNYLNVYALNGDNDYENDKTSAWKKLLQNTDTCIIKLYKQNGTLASYQPTLQSFINDTYSKYATIDWYEVLQLDGQGYYYIQIDSTILNYPDSEVWGEYFLSEFDAYKVEKTFKLKAFFNSNQTIESIDFTNSYVEDDIRLKGWFGDRQPNTEIDNIIYQNRESKKVTRENINSYILTTNFEKYENIKKLTDLYLLSENKLFISDFNSLNPSNEYLNVPVIVDSSPELKYTDTSRLVQLTCKLTDKVKNSRSYY